MTTCRKGKALAPTTHAPLPRHERIFTDDPIRILRLAEVLKRTGLGKTKVYELQARGAFPMRVPITDSGSAVGWVEAEIEAWLRNRLAGRPGYFQATRERRA